MSEIKTIAHSILSMMDKIVQHKVQNSIVIGMYRKIILPFFSHQIERTPDAEIKVHLQFAYDQLKPYFEKKQMKDMIDEGNRLSGFNLQDKGLLKKEGEYF